jgi:DNA-binding winged helix-turn-helix (wHTH) protein
MMANKSFVFRSNDVEVREREFTLSKAGKVLMVEPKAFRVLLFLLQNPQRLISKQELLNSVWGDAIVTEGSLTRCIWLLRRLLEDDINQPRYIATVATVGYRFVCKVEVSEDASGNLEAVGNPDGFDGKERVEKDAAKGIVGGVSHPEAPIGYGVAGQANSGGSRVGRRNRMRRWLLPGAAALVVSFVAATWCFRHPLPRLVSGHTQNTDFADGASVPGLGFAGTRLHSVFSPDGKELYYLLRKLGSRAFNSGELWMVDLDSGRTEAVLPGVPMSEFDISPDGQHVTFAALDAEGDSHVWVAPLDRHAPPKQLNAITKGNQQ